MTQKNFYETETDSQAENRSVVSKGRKEEEWTRRFRLAK